MSANVALLFVIGKILTTIIRSTMIKSSFMSVFSYQKCSKGRPTCSIVKYFCIINVKSDFLLEELFKKSFFCTNFALVFNRYFLQKQL